MRVAAVERDDHQHTAALGEWSLWPACIRSGQLQPTAPEQTGGARAGTGDQKLLATQMVISMLATTSGIRAC